MNLHKLTVLDISFESEEHNIFDPYFSSQPSSSSAHSMTDSYYDEEDADLRNESSGEKSSSCLSDSMNNSSRSFSYGSEI
jgi:hypothetical protein